MGRLSLFWRLFGAFAAMGALVVYRVVLRRVLAPLERLTRLMQRVDPLTPGRRLDTVHGDAEVVALAEAFNGMLDRIETERRESALRALAAQEAERRRIARELHDEIGQTLTGLVLRSETIARRAPEELRAELGDLREAARRGAEDVCTIARRLRPEALDELGLRSALIALSASVGQEGALEVERSFDGDLDLSADQELVIYRVAQVALTNVVRHAGASRARLQLRSREDGVSLTVRDDGVGLSADATADPTGIRGMRERALLVGGELAIRPARPRGTEVRLWLPRRTPR